MRFRKYFEIIELKISYNGDQNHLCRFEGVNGESDVDVLKD